MANVREIEVKYRVYDACAVEWALGRRGLVLSPPLRQDDQAYAEIGWQYGMSKLGRAFIRLRTQEERHIFTLKRPLDNELACLEHETDVIDRDQMHHAVLSMGFYPTVRIIKTRRLARLGDLSLCLDVVEHAGAFLEVERVIGPGQSGTDVQAELDRFVRSLGLELARTTETYDSLVRAALGGSAGATSRT